MTARSPGRRLAVGLGLSLLSVLLVLGVLEVVLRLHPRLLGDEFANGALSKYTTRAGGIYYPDRSLRMVFMIPNMKTTMYANQYVWHHETDALGWRNKPLHVPAEVVLLGDSIVYGHGVEFEDTIGAQLERLSGRTVANLGQQGDCAFQEAYVLTEYAPVFKPRWVFLVFSSNDIADLYDFLSDGAMQEFIARPVAEIRYPPRTVPAAAIAARERKIRGRWIGKRVEEEAFVAKMFRWIGYRIRRDFPNLVASADAAPRVVPPGVADDPTSLGWRYTDKAIQYMDHVARRHGARFAVVPLAAGRQYEILESVAARRRVPFVPTAPEIFERPMYLERDSHLSPAGSRKLAEILTAFMRRQDGLR